MVPDALEIGQTVVDSIVAHARAALPNECCGLLIGVAGRIRRSVPATNLEPGPSSYLIDPADHFAAIRSARAEGCEVLGAYHSHPGAEPVPSRRDVAEASGTDFVYLIVSIGPDERADVRAYRVGEGRATAVGLTCISDREMDSRR
jgi:proteasome lid subunit RPN8/RPN11